MVSCIAMVVEAVSCRFEGGKASRIKVQEGSSSSVMVVGCD